MRTRSGHDIFAIREGVAMALKSQSGKDSAHGLMALSVLSLVVGVATGLIGTAFRLSLDRADVWRNSLVAWAHERHVAGFFIVVAVCAAATALAAWLVRRFSPQASGSGIPHVEAVVNREIPMAPYRLIPVKFVGGWLAIGSGLALGREGPSVQMGATAAHLLGKIFRRSEDDRLILLAAGAGAGLATAFNAPIAGAIFVLEELVKRFDTRITIVTFGASAGAIAVSRMLLGHSPDFHVNPLAFPNVPFVAFSLLLGVIAGVVGVAYNRAILSAIRVTKSSRRFGDEIIAGLIGAAVGCLAWWKADLVGGGDAITQRVLGGSIAPAVLLSIFVVRFALGSISYAARTPGGLFAPMLVLGAVVGLMLGQVSQQWFPETMTQPTALAIVGMAAFFTAVVRAPLTGIILAIEMTGSFTMFMPMLLACFAAMAVPTMLRNEPIYESLRVEPAGH